MARSVSRYSTTSETTVASSDYTRYQTAWNHSQQPMSTVPLTVIFATSQDETTHEDEAISSEQLVLGTTTVATTALSVGYIIWLLRSGSLLASLAASLPAWTSFDPLPILDSSSSDEQEDEESLQDLVS